MSDFQLVEPRGWEYDLQSVYSAYMGYFQFHGVPWHDWPWGQVFETFDQFLSFSWPVVTITDARTGRAHIVTRMTSIAAFVKMVKTRFGETLPQAANMNMLTITPLETTQRHLRHISDWPAYRKLHAMLPAVALAALKSRVRMGDPNVIRELWAVRDKTFLAIDFESRERDDDRSCAEWGYAVLRCNHLEAAGAWPPKPDKNYRKGHYIISEHASVNNKASPTVSWQYAFGDSQVVPKAKLPRIIQSVLSSLLTPDSETVANDLVLVAHGLQTVLQHLDDMKIRLPSNVLLLDVAYLERALFNTGERGPMQSRKTGKSRLPESLLTLSGILHSFSIEPPCALQNAGNDAFMTLVVFQRMADPRGGTGTLGAEMAVNGNGTGKQGRDGHENRDAVRRAATVAARFFRPLNTHVDDKRDSTRVVHGGADEMGKKLTKRASMFSMLTSARSVAVAADKDKPKNEASNGSTSGSGSGLGGWSILPGQKRHSTFETLRR